MPSSRASPTTADSQENEYARKASKDAALDRAFSMFCHSAAAGLLVYLCASGGAPAFERYGSQIVVIVGLGLVSSTMLLARTGRAQTFIMFYFRIVFLVIARLMVGDDLVVVLLLLLPFAADCAVHLKGPASLALASAMALFFIADDAAAGHGPAATACRALVQLGLSASLLYCHRRFSDCAELLAKTYNDRANLTQAIERLTSANSGYRAYAEKATQVSAENERNRITREIHDVVGYALINVKMLMNVGKVYLKNHDGDVSAVFDSAADQVDAALQETRQILYAQRSLKREAVSGLEALASLVRTFEEIADIDIEMNYGNIPANLDDRVAKTIYRIIQEGLVNAFKHGNADRVSISLWLANDEMVVNVRDNGSGAGKSGDGIGLAGMRERLADLGGSLDARKVADGYVLDARIPWTGKEEELVGH